MVLDSLVVLKEIHKKVKVETLIFHTKQNEKRFNSNIDWSIVKTYYHIEGRNCLVLPILIHQHCKGKVIFPHFRCLIQIENLPLILLQDLTFEQWTSLA